MGAAVPVVRTVQALRAQVRAWRAAGETIALVPTMGALHRGHLDLVRLAKARCKRAVTSIFVNPAQFAPHEDFDRYPRDETGDLAKLAGVGCDLVWSPGGSVMYPDGFATQHRARRHRGGARERLPPAFLRRRGNRVRQALHAGGARHRRVRREGLPAALRGEADGTRPRPAARDRRYGDGTRGRRLGHELAQCVSVGRGAQESAATPSCDYRHCRDGGQGRGHGCGNSPGQGRARSRRASEWTTSRCAMPRR